MALAADAVSAVIVTKGDTDLGPILATLPYGEVVVWDNSQRERDAKCYGRFLAIDECTRDVIYFQDDDLLFTAHAELLAAYEPDRIVANMPSPWYENTGYDVLGCALVGAGSLVQRDLPWPALQLYLERYPQDDLFYTYCDQVHGILTPSARYDFGYEILPLAYAPDRINVQPGAPQRKAIIQQRALELRAGVAS